MQYKLRQILDEMKTSWGPLSILPSSDAVRIFDKAVHKHVQNPFVLQAIGALMVKGLREKGIKSGIYVDYSLMAAIIEKHIELNTALYVLVPYFTEHAPDDLCQGGLMDYEDEQAAPGKLEMFDDYEEMRERAYEFLHDDVLNISPVSATNARVEVRILDGEGEIEFGQWKWDRHSGEFTWDQPERH